MNSVVGWRLGVASVATNGLTGPVDRAPNLRERRRITGYEMPKPASESKTLSEGRMCHVKRCEIVY